MVPVTLNHKVSSELLAEFSHSTFDDCALGFLDGPGQFNDQVGVVVSENGKN